ncbi:MAG: hypothetical protein ABEJ68_09515 [Halobacteriaceae archaeon]
MTTPDWLSAGRVVVDPDGERWRIREVGPVEVELGHPERGAHTLRTRDLVAWVEDGDWERG